MAGSNEPTPSARADKTIVEKRGSSQSGKAVKAVRAGLGQAPVGAPPNAANFEPDVLRRHAASQMPAMLALLPMLALAAYIVHETTDLKVLAAWLVGNVALAVTNLLLCRRFTTIERADINAVKWQSIFLAFQLAGGLLWAVFFAHLTFHTAEGAPSLTAFAGALVIIALSLLSAQNLKLGVVAATLPLLAIVVARLGMMATMPALSLALVVVASLGFTQYIGHLIRKSQIDFFASRAERDQLVLELDASRGISEEARRRAEEANLAKSRFLATMSHELRTPLNAILGFSEVMSNEVMGPIDNPHYKEYLTDIHRSGAHLLKLINEILDLSRIEAGRYELNEEEVNLGHEVEESQQMVKLKANQKGVQLVTQVQPNMPGVWADARAVRQIVLNLLSNALKFTPSGGTIWVKCGWTSSGGQYITIRDTGPGIPEDEIPIVLSSFGQGSIAIKSAEQGTGLGLPIVQALMQMHDGKFTLKSKLRAGTQVTATFPRARIMPSKPAATAPERAPLMRRKPVADAPAMSA